MNLITEHAKCRMQQRGIGDEALWSLLDYGTERHDHRGGVLVFFDKTVQKRLAREVDETTRKKLPGLTRMYAVISSEGEVVTVGHRYRRIQHS